MSRILALILLAALTGPAWSQDISPNPNGGTPGGAAGGDLTGTYPNPTIKSSVGLSGSPTTTTQSANDNSTKISTTAYVDSALTCSVAFASLPSASTYSGKTCNVTDVGVNGSLWRSNGTKWAPVNGVIALAQNNMPWISLSSGSIAAGGALTGITALLRVYPKAWCYLPANAVAAVSAAGWRYCTFSTTTAGTIFLDQPPSSYPIIWPASPTAVTAGQGSYTGAGAANAIIQTPTVTLPAGVIGINARVYVDIQDEHAGSAGTSSSLMEDGLQVGGVTFGTSTASLIYHYMLARGALNDTVVFSRTTSGVNPQTNYVASSVDYSSGSHTFAQGMQASSSAVDNLLQLGVIYYLDNDGQ